jgi:hypothetical protein
MVPGCVDSGYLHHYGKSSPQMICFASIFASVRQAYTLQ